MLVLHTSWLDACVAKQQGDSKSCIWLQADLLALCAAVMELLHAVALSCPVQTPPPPPAWHLLGIATKPLPSCATPTPPPPLLGTCWALPLKCCRPVQNPLPKRHVAGTPALPQRHAVSTPVRGLAASGSLPPGAPSDRQARLLRGVFVWPEPQKP